MTESTATNQAALDWPDLAPLHGLLAGGDERTRAAAAEAAARLPLTPAAWERVSSVIDDLLDAQDPAISMPALARAGVHAPLPSARQRLRSIAQDGGHPAQHAAAVALSEVGDDSVLPADVARLLSGPLTDRTALRLAALPLELLRTAPVMPEANADADVASWWTAVAAARLGDTGRLDGWLDRLRADATTLPTPARNSLAAVWPLPADLLAHLERRLVAGSPGHELLRNAWLVPAPVRPTAQRLDDFAGPLGRFMTAVGHGSAAEAGVELAADAAGLPDGVAPDPQAVYDAWLRVADQAEAAWQPVAWTLGRAGAGNLLSRLSRWLEDLAAATAACGAVRDAAAWLTTPAFPATGPAGPPPWPPPPAFVDQPPGAPAQPAPPDSWAAPMPSFEAALPPMRGIEPAAPTPKPPAYARMSCPSAVVVGEEFELDIGLASRPTRGVTAQQLALPERPEFTLTIQVIVDGFSLRAGEQPTVELPVTAASPYPTGTLHLTATADPEYGPVRSILAVYSVDGLTVGSATRAVEVVVSPADLPFDARTAPATGVDTAIPPAAQAADLTITISKGDDSGGQKLLWSFQSPHVSGSAAALTCNVGEKPADFAKRLMKNAGKLQGESLTAEIIGAGRLIARLLPAEVHDALRATAAAIGGPPNVLLLSADPYVPWELARIEPPWLAAAPRMLGAQAAVGRWALREPGPTSEPPRSVSVRDMTIVRGVYERVIGFNQLKHAEQEALDLHAAYGATLVDAAEGPFFASLRGEPPAEVLHFAMHGRFDPTGLQDGLILVDGNVVDPLMILGADLSRHPFVFLNACQVGMADQTLGQYGGMAQSFVEAGASAVVAPLWVVKDDVARDLSLRFYESAFAGTAPAEFLRRERARDGSGTHLAYVLYGHPLLQLTRAKEAGDGDPVGP